MYFVLGLMTAGLLALALTPAIWRRALRLTRARVEAGIPVSRSEIAADKDRLRAGFAASNRHLEMEIGRLNERTTSQIVEINHARDEITALSTEGRRLNEAVAGLEKSVDDLRTNHGDFDEKLNAANAALKQSEEELESKAAALAVVRDELVESTQLSEALRMEIGRCASPITRGRCWEGPPDRHGGAERERFSAATSRAQTDTSRWRSGA